MKTNLNDGHEHCEMLEGYISGRLKAGDTFRTRYPADGGLPVLTEPYVYEDCFTAAYREREKEEQPNGR